MPNDCWSEVFFHGSAETIRSLLHSHLDYQTLFGDKDTECIGEFKRRHVFHTETTIEFRFLTAWKPPYEFMKKLLDKFPELWIRCFWEEEGGAGGAWIADSNDIKEFQWQGPCIEARVQESHIS